MPPALLDAWLLERFPGKTLDELDAMDLPRYWRAVAVQRVRAIEDMRKLHLRGKYKPTPQEWRQIMQHDRLVAAEEVT